MTVEMKEAVYLLAAVSLEVVSRERKTHTTSKHQLLWVLGRVESR